MDQKLCKRSTCIINLAWEWLWTQEAVETSEAPARDRRQHDVSINLVQHCNPTSIISTHRFSHAWHRPEILDSFADAGMESSYLEFSRRTRDQHAALVHINTTRHTAVAAAPHPRMAIHHLSCCFGVSTMNTQVLVSTQQLGIERTAACLLTIYNPRDPTGAH